MPKFHVEIPHSLSAEEAQSRLRRVAEAMHDKFKDKVSDMSQSWNGNTLTFAFKTFGIKVTGDIESLENMVRVTGELPLTAMMFKGKIESEMKQLLGRYMT